MGSSDNHSGVPLPLFGDRSATDRRLVGDQSATKHCVGIVCNRCNWPAISGQPVGDLSATTKNLSTIDLVAERFHLQQPKLPCDHIVPANVCNRSATNRRPPCNRPATSLRQLEILVARRSPTGCKLCVTGALINRAPGFDKGIKYYNCSKIAFLHMCIPVNVGIQICANCFQCVKHFTILVLKNGI